jgi:hypothetical protein
LFLPRTAGKQVAYTPSEFLDVLGIELLTTFGGPLVS